VRKRKILGVAGDKCYKCVCIFVAKVNNIIKQSFFWHWKLDKMGKLPAKCLPFTSGKSRTTLKLMGCLFLIGR